MPIEIPTDFRPVLAAGVDAAPAMAGAGANTSDDPGTSRARAPSTGRKRAPRPTYADGALTRVFKFPSKTYPKSSYYVTATEIVVRIRKARKKWKLTVPKKRVVSYRTNRWFAKPRWIELELTVTQALKLGLVDTSARAVDPAAAAERLVPDTANQLDGLAARAVQADARPASPPDEDGVTTSADEDVADVADSEWDGELAVSLSDDDTPDADSVDTETDPWDADEVASASAVTSPIESPDRVSSSMAVSAPFGHHLLSDEEEALLPMLAPPSPQRRDGWFRTAVLAIVLLAFGGIAWRLIDAGNPVAPRAVLRAADTSTPGATASVHHSAQDEQPTARPMQIPRQVDDTALAQQSQLDPIRTPASERQTTPEVVPAPTGLHDTIATGSLDAPAAAPRVATPLAPTTMTALNDRMPPQAPALLERDTAFCHSRAAVAVDDTVIQFDFASASPGKPATEALEHLANTLKQCAALRMVIEGHTDADGDRERNLALSLRRAEAVRQVLVSAGATPEQLSVAGFGQTRPLVPNDSDANKRQNRRIELVLK